MPTTQAVAPFGYWLAFAACAVLGLALGLHLGRLLAYPFRYGTPPATLFALLKSGIAWAIITVAGLLASRFGGGSDAMWGYLLGLAVGLLISWWYPRLPAVFSESEVRRIIDLNNRLSPEVRDPEKRATLALLPFRSAADLKGAQGKSTEQVAGEMEEALDALPEIEPPEA